MADTDRARIESDIRLLRGALARLKPKAGQASLFDMARRYCEDTEYHLKKGDLVTAFGSINYAHGLLDSLKYLGKKEKKKGGSD